MQPVLWPYDTLKKKKMKKGKKIIIINGVFSSVLTGTVLVESVFVFFCICFFFYWFEAFATKTKMILQRFVCEGNDIV